MTGKVELDWHAMEKVLVYGYVSRGAKSAGFNTGLLDQNGIFNSVTPKQVPFNQETLTAYEIGVKSEFADGLVRLNVAAYYYDYTNFQAFAFQNLGQLIFNTDATVNGGEMELTLSPTDRFEASFGASWIHEAEAQDIPSYTGRIRDRRMVLAPEYQLNTILRYTVPLPHGANITAQWDGFYQTKTYFDIQNYPISQSDDYSVWNARLIYNSSDDKWTARRGSTTCSTRNICSIRSTSRTPSASTNSAMGDRVGSAHRSATSGRRMTARAWAFALVLASSAAHADARTDYMLNCQGCHADDGRGSPGHVPDLRDELGLLLHVPGGREYLVQVPGSRSAAIDDAALAAVLNWMLPTFSAATLPPDFTPYTRSEIARLRSAPFEDTAAVRVRLLEAIGEQSH